MVKNYKQEQFCSDGIQLNLFSNNEFEETKETANNELGVENKFSSSFSSVNLKNEAINDIKEVIAINEINGLTYVRNFISKSEHDLLLAKINSQPWLTDLKRRVQHYGYKYDYANHQINKSMYIAPLPDWALEVANKLYKSYSPTLPDQVIVNEYEPGQGIANHTDCRTCFKDTIISLSLGSPCVMDFTNPKLDLKKSLLLEPRSLIVLQGKARDEWTHGIAKRKSDKWEGKIIKRESRVSLTFRTVIMPN